MHDVRELEKTFRVIDSSALILQLRAVEGRGVDSDDSELGGSQ